MNSIFSTPSSHYPEIFNFALILGAICTVVLIVQMYGWGRIVAAIPRLIPVKRKEPLTPNELEFFGRLKRALPDFEVWPQVSMGALIEPTVSESHPDFWQIRRLFQSKICDYVIANKGSVMGEGVIAVIELDDKTHDKLKDAQRDQLLLSANIPTIRYESRAKPAEKSIRSDLLKLLSV